MESLLETAVFDFNSSAVEFFVRENIKGDSKQDKAVSLYYAVRDKLFYNPYEINLDSTKNKASYIIKRGFGHCIDKAIVMIACLRSVGIASKLGLAKVVNHIGTERMEVILKTNVLVPHGYVDININGSWLKATPAFNDVLCRVLNVNPLDFDAKNDSIFQEYDRQGADFMEYIEDYGSFDEFPTEFIRKTLEDNYPHLFFDSNGDRVFSNGELISSYLKRNNLKLNTL